jgi:hypothetical protein
MSRAYRIRVRESLSDVIRAEDHASTRLELLPVLPRERLADLLAAELARRGFTVQDGVASRTEAGGVEVCVELATGEVRASLAGQEAVHLEVEREARVVEERAEEGRAAAHAQARGELQRQRDASAEALRRALTARLEAALRELRGELDAASTRVAAEALKERAAQLGTVEEVQEDAETGSLTIRVRL